MELSEKYNKVYFNIPVLRPKKFVCYYSTFKEYSPEFILKLLILYFSQTWIVFKRQSNLYPTSYANVKWL